MHKCQNIAKIVFGAFLIVFTFVMWPAAKWISFAIGIILVIMGLRGKHCFCKGACMEEKPKKMPAKKKK